MNHTLKLMLGCEIGIVMVMGAGCVLWEPQPSDDVVRNVTGGKVAMERSDAGYLFTLLDSGEIVGVGSSIRIPNGFPVDMLVFPSATPTSAFLGGEDQISATLSLTSDATVNDVAAWYADEYQKLVWKEETFFASDGAVLRMYQKDGVRVSLTIGTAPSGNGSTIVLVRSRG